MTINEQKLNDFLDRAVGDPAELYMSLKLPEREINGNRSDRERRAAS